MKLNSANINVMVKACRKAAKTLIRDFGEVEKLQVSVKGPGDFVSASDQVLIVLEGEPTSMMDAYSLIKILNQEKGVKKFSIFINKASSELEAKQNFEVFSKNLVHKFLDARAYYAGFLPMSKVLKQAVIMKKPVMIHNRKSKEGIAFQKLAGVMLKAPMNDKKGICFFE